MRWKILVISVVVAVGLTVWPCRLRVMRSKGGFGVRVVPIVYGMPGPELMQRAQQGKVHLGGCILPFLPPAWAIVVRLPTSHYAASRN